MLNPYLPYPVRIDDITIETEDKNLKTFKFVFLDSEDEGKFDYNAGQFAELSVTGKGEIPIGIASSPSEKGFVMFTVNKVGLVSSWLHAMKVGDIMGTPVISVNHETSIVKAGSLMILRRVKQLPVMDNGKLSGIITLTDIIDYIAKGMK